MSIFEKIKKIDEFGEEYWSSRDLAKALDYNDYRNFLSTIDKAMQACKNSGQLISDHFGEATDMVTIGSGAKRKLSAYHLSRYACYLIVQNADPNKDIVASGQTYFAIQTRKQELSENFPQLNEDERRLQLRQEMKTHNIKLAETANKSGIKNEIDYAVFQNHGYKGLYGGLDAKAIHARKKLKKSHKILDYMGSTELAANLFRATQTEEKLRNDKVVGKNNANKVHFEVGSKVRQTIKELGGTMPEDLPTPNKGVNKIQKEREKLLIKNKK